MKKNSLTKLDRAKKRVAAIKGFYNHLVVYLIINLALIIFKEKVVVTILSKKALGDPNFLNWIDWNVYGTPIIWGIGLAIHALVVFGSRPKFIRNWEEQKIEEFMNQE